MDAVDSSLASTVSCFLRDAHGDMLTLLEALVRAESPTDDASAQADVQALLTDVLGDLGFDVERLPGDASSDVESAGHLLARPAGRDVDDDRPVQLLLGHCDTVWPRGTLDAMPFEVTDGRVRGPGVFDMKGGLTQGLFAIRALQGAGVEPDLAPVFFINSDEERGSPTSAHHVKRLAKTAHRAFVLEPALGLDGKIKTARKGSGRFTILIHGKSAHAGLDPEAGSSAILELSHVVQTLHALNDPDAGVTVNVGTIDGGTRPNVVAAESSAEVDVRVETQAQAERVAQAIRDLQATVPGTTLDVRGDVGRPPMERTPGSRRLWAQAQDAAAALDLTLDEGRSGGVSDGNLASQHTPTLDGLGAVGDGAHARHEFCFADKMVERSALLALLLTLPPLSS